MREGSLSCVATNPPGKCAGHDGAGDSEQQGAAGEGGAGARHQAEEGQAADGPGARGRHAEPTGGAGVGLVFQIGQWVWEAKMTSL